MSPVQHVVTGPALTFSLEKEVLLVRVELAKSPSRFGRTLVKDGPLRVTLIGVNAGHGLAEHSAPGPVTIHVLDGAIDVTAAGILFPLTAGTLLALDAGVAHAVTSPQGGIFLLTVLHGVVGDRPVRSSAQPSAPS